MGCGLGRNRGFTAIDRGRPPDFAGAGVLVLGWRRAGTPLGRILTDRCSPGSPRKDGRSRSAVTSTRHRGQNSDKQSGRIQESDRRADPSLRRTRHMASAPRLHPASDRRPSPPGTASSSGVVVRRGVPRLRRRVDRQRRASGHPPRPALLGARPAVVPSGYLLTYGGFMLLGGRVADLLGRRRVLVSGTVLVGVASLVGGLANDAGLLVAPGWGRHRRRADVAGGPVDPDDDLPGRLRPHKALGVWVGSAASRRQSGCFLGGVLTEGPGWRWVMLVNPVACVLVLPAIFRLIPGDRRRATRASSTFPARARDRRHAAARLRPGEGAGRRLDRDARCSSSPARFILLAAFVLVELRGKSPLLPLSVFRIKGLAAADATQLIAFAVSSRVLLPHAVHAERPGLLADQDRAGLPAAVLLCRVAAGIASSPARQGGYPTADRRRVVDRRRRPVLAVPNPGRWLVRRRPAPRHAGDGGRAGRGVRGRHDCRERGCAGRQGRASRPALLNASQQVGAALGLAIFSAIATSRTDHLLTSGHPASEALTSDSGGTARRRHLPARRRDPRAAHQQRARRTDRDHDRRQPEPGGVVMSAASEQDNAWASASSSRARWTSRSCTSPTTRSPAIWPAGNDRGNGQTWTPAATAGWATFTRQLHLHHQAEARRCGRACARRFRGPKTSPSSTRWRPSTPSSIRDSRRSRRRSRRTTRPAWPSRPEGGRWAARAHAARENAALPLIEAHLGPDGWNSFATHARRMQGVRGAAEFFPWLLDGAPRSHAGEGAPPAAAAGGASSTAGVGAAVSPHATLELNAVRVLDQRAQPATGSDAVIR